MAPSVCQRAKGGLSGSIRQKHWRSNNGAVALLATRNTGGGGGGAGEELSRLYSLDSVMMMQPVDQQAGAAELRASYLQTHSKLWQLAQ